MVALAAFPLYVLGAGCLLPKLRVIASTRDFGPDIPTHSIANRAVFFALKALEGAPRDGSPYPQHSRIVFVVQHVVGVAVFDP